MSKKHNRLTSQKAVPLPKTPVRFLLSGYFLLINAASFALFGYDKHQATTHQYRIPERTLWLTALAGGWVGGFAGMNHFHHKTKKEEFRVPYYLASGINAVGLGFFARRFVKDPVAARRMIEGLLKK
jgi:uncharacterized membrane protein YsdA (DUF1294 family)